MFLLSVLFLCSYKYRKICPLKPVLSPRLKDTLEAFQHELNNLLNEHETFTGFSSFESLWKGRHIPDRPWPVLHARLGWAMWSHPSISPPFLHDKYLGKVTTASIGQIQMLQDRTGFLWNAVKPNLSRREFVIFFLDLGSLWSTSRPPERKLN